ncbi:hypothetical protein ACIP9C_11415 [Lysinibacillus sp. NPDC093210]|uniref:hypothetical protein n=1 Tax=Lysinibacillus sp. NPDC093210 TaxID=3364133 RepID=UPI00381616D8
MKMKKLIVFLTVLALFLSQVPFYAKAYSNGEDEKEYKESLENIISVIEEYIEISSDGITILDEDNIVRNLNQEDINLLNELAREQGNYNIITKASLMEDLDVHFTNINEKIEKGELKVLDNGAMIDSTDKNFYIQGGSTYDETYWWGKRRYMSTSAARQWVYDLRDAAAVSTGLALASVVFGKLGVIPATINGITALWTNQLANRVEYHNGNTNRGIRADLYWVLVFNIEPQ